MTIHGVSQDEARRFSKAAILRVGVVGHKARVRVSTGRVPLCIRSLTGQSANNDLWRSSVVCVFVDPEESDESQDEFHVTQGRQRHKRSVDSSTIGLKSVPSRTASVRRTNPEKGVISGSILPCGLTFHKTLSYSGVEEIKAIVPRL